MKKPKGMGLDRFIKDNGCPGCESKDDFDVYLTEGDTDGIVESYGCQRCDARWDRTLVPVSASYKDSISGEIIDEPYPRILQLEAGEAGALILLLEESPESDFRDDLISRLSDCVGRY